MLSRNNFTERSKKIGSQNKQEHFSIRKLTVGAASVLIGLGFVNANNQVVKADAQKPQGESNVQTNNQGQTTTSSAKQQQADTTTTAGTNASVNDNQTQAGKHSQAAASDQAKVKLTTFAGLTSFLRDTTVPETPKTSEEGATSAPSSSAEQQPEDTAEQSKKVEAEQKLNAAATSLNTALDQAKTISTSDKYKQDTQERQEALQAAVTQAQTVANKYHDLGSSPLSEDDQTKLLADITAASDKLAALLAEYTTEKEQVSPQDGISLRSNSGTDGNVTWTYNSGTLTFTSGGTLSSARIQSFGISGNITKIEFQGSANAIKLAENSSYKFAYLSSLTEIDGLNKLDTSAVKNMSYMFYYDTGITTLNLSDWNTSNVYNMSYMFDTGGYSHLTTITLGSGWHTSRDSNGNGTNMSCMFADLYGRQGQFPGLTTLDLTGLDTSNAGNMAGMFYNDKELTSITFGNTWSTSNVTNMSQMFENCQQLTSLNLSTWDTSNVTNMSYMFSMNDSWPYSQLNSITFTGWNTSSVTNMNYMFKSCRSLTTLDLSAWDTHKVTNMSNMFYCCSGLTSLDLRHTAGTNYWDLASVSTINMSSMFYSCSSLTTLTLTNWDTSKVTDMSSMFYNCNSLQNLRISNWKTGNVVNMNNMFASCGNLKSISDSETLPINPSFDVHKWDTSKVIYMNSMFYNCSSLTKLITTSSTLAENKWNTGTVCYMSSMFSGCTGLTTGTNTANASINIFDWDTSHVMTMSGMFYNCSGLTSLDLHHTADTNKWKLTDVSNISMDQMFRGCTSLTALTLTNWDTSKVNTMYAMFRDCSSLTTSDNITDISSWNTGNVANMKEMFENCNQLKKLNISNWNTSNVQNMAQMFQDCKQLGNDGTDTLNIGKWNTSKVRGSNTQYTDNNPSGWVESFYDGMQFMFYNCTSLKKLDLHAYTDGPDSHWDVSDTAETYPDNRTNTMDRMFAGCSNLEDLDIHSWDTTNVTRMSYMFYNCTKLNSTTIHDGSTPGAPTAFTLNSSGTYWNTGKVTTMQGMFKNCTSLNNIDFKGGWINSHLADMSYMFYGCTSLTGASVDANGIADFKTSTVSTMSYMFYGDSKIKDLVLKYNASNLNDMSYMFAKMYTPASGSPVTPETGLRYIDITGIDTSTVTDMSHLFDGDKLLNNLDVTHFNTNFTENMSFMFADCVSLTADGTTEVLDDIVSDPGSLYRPSSSTVKCGFSVSSWNTRYVTDMSYMFAGTTALTKIGDVSQWKTSNVQYMNSMFYNAKKLGSDSDLDLSGWNTSSVTDMNYMFSGAEGLTTLKLGPNWDTSNVGTNGGSGIHHLNGMVAMFNDNKNLTTIDNNGARWDTSNVTNMSNMFNGDAKITNLDFVDNFNTSKVQNMNNMFNGAESLTALKLGSNWTTKSITSYANTPDYWSDGTLCGVTPPWNSGLLNMFSDTKKLKELDISSFVDINSFTSNIYSRMSNMFNNMGADSSVQTFKLTLGQFKINPNAFGNFKWMNIQAKGDSIDDNHPNGNSYTLAEFKSLYNPNSDAGCPVGTITYILRSHGADNERYEPQTVVIQAHMNQHFYVNNLTQYPMSELLSFTDREDGTSKSYNDLISKTDDINPDKKAIDSVKWLLDPVKRWSMDSEGNVVPSGGVLDQDGKIVADAKNTPAADKGNAVIQVTYGDGTKGNVPVKIELPNFGVGDMQEVTAIGISPDDTQARAAVKTSDLGNPHPTEWGKSDLTYSWVKGEHDLSPLEDNDVSSAGDLHVAVKISYTNKIDQRDDGYEVIPVTLLVNQYSDEFPISIVTDGVPPVARSIATHAIGDSGTLVVPKPKAFSKSGTNVTDMTNLIMVTDAASGFTNVDHPLDVSVDRIIDHLDWASGGAPTVIDNGAGGGSNCQIVAYYTDRSQGAGVWVKVKTYGGKSNDSALSATVGIDANRPLATTYAAVDALDPDSVTAISNRYSLNNNDFKWSTLPDRVNEPSTATGGIQHDFIIIDYHDGTTQAVPVILKVNDTSTRYNNVKYDNSTRFSIHAADDTTAVPILDFNTIKNHLTYGTPPAPIPIGDIRTVDWASTTGSVPGYTSDDISSTPEDAMLQATYQDGSISAPITVPVTIEGATVPPTDTDPVSQVHYAKYTYPDGQVPPAADFLNAHGTKAPASYGLNDADYKWVDASSHQELAVNDATGNIAAAVEVTYHDGTHQYLPVTLILQTMADQHAGEFTPNSLTTHVGVDPNNFNVHSYVTNHGSLAEGQGANDYQIVWQTQPDTSAAGLKDDGTKDVNAAARITFNKDGSQLTVPVPVTINGAVLKNSDTAKTLYLNDAALSADEQADIINYYVNSSKLGSYAPTYTIKLNDSKAKITVHYNDGITQTLPNVPFKVIRPVTQQATTYQGNTITAQQVLANYSELASIPGMTMTDELSGINFNQTGTQTGQAILNYASGDPAFSDFNGSFAVPVTVKVNVRPVDNSMAANFHPNVGGVQVPQYTDLPSHNNYADQAVTNANEMPAGTNYTWDTTSTANTSTKDKTDKTFVTVNYPDGSVDSIPVKVNVSDPQESDIVLKHNAYLYDKQGKRVNGQTLQSGSTVKTYGTALINNRMYYIIEADKYYIKASNVVGKKRKLDSTAHVYDKYGQQTNDQVIYAGTGVTTYGTPVMIKGQKYYLIDDNKYVPAANFPPASDTWIDPTVHGNSDTSGGVKKETMHAAYFYNKNGKRKSKAILKAGSSVVTYGKTTIKHKQYYVLDNDEFLLASNIDAVKRHIKHQASVVDRYGKATGKKLHKGSKVSVYGKAVKIKGVSCYVIGDNQYVKASKLK
ncbi:BspA family leucine-rich repeat surface protein [Lactobacillus sp. ESL0791]|uniref:BspA family leucine-rich repeat surface protein n=1 Tax=Lactobacillus sp. ESL0791 TaxID=2983234 RepID=UPI0023F7D107|nr:BspA family leucine-rich repeat surface protein [Lactobacillus sp. ESL0791]MDF7639790.1 BspA family leucine-rich repeat surface protein [Lactobacillus sp. ESL0791]